MIVKTVLDNGIRLLTEDVAAVQSVSVGVLVGCGARSESEATNGISHFIEHMLFKGTSSLSAYEIASRIEATGGNINAFTGKENTSYYLKIPSYRLTLGLEVLADMLGNPAFLGAEIENEKGVVLSEISQLEDSPEEYIHDIFEEELWRSHPLRFPVLGSRKAVKGFSEESIRGFFASRYRAGEIIISIAGAVEHEKTIAAVVGLFGDVKPSLPLAGAENQVGLGEGVFPPPKPFRILRRQKNQQVNLVIGVPTFGASDSRRYPLALLNAVLGGAMSSRLFQEVREKRGLAYSIGSFISSYSDAGFWGIYAGTSRDNFGKVVSCCIKECEKIVSERLGEKELADAKEMLKGNFLLGMEGTDAHMAKLSRDELTFGRQIATAEVLAGIEAISASAVLDLAQDIFSKGISLAALGDLKERDLARAFPVIG